MSFVRPEARILLNRWSEMALALSVVLAGLWLIRMGGYFLGPVGVALCALGGAWALLALRRIRFQRPVSAPGVVEVDEGQVGYLGPTFGGYVSLRELVEVRMIRLHGQPHWRLKQADGQTLLIPASATGADGLFDAFASLPGASTAAFAAAVDLRGDAQIVWRHPARVALT